MINDDQVSENITIDAAFILIQFLFDNDSCYLLFQEIAYVHEWLGKWTRIIQIIVQTSLYWTH